MRARQVHVTRCGALRGTVYHVVGRYYRRWIDEIVDDREEVVPPEKSFRFQKNVREKDMEPWTKEGALDPGSAF
ncbi:MAG: hypothetical protein KA941_09180 [Flavobacteriales bacterium]|nr:hypothetical protein [Flavobacteriales bacterium]